MFTAIHYKIIQTGVFYMKHLNTFILAVLAGLSIGFGATVFLACENRILGSVLFTIGLFIICTKQYNLFTGKVGYLLDNKISYLLDLLIVWLGNFAGTGIFAVLIRLTRFGEAYSATASSIIDAKLSGSWLSVFILGIFCNVLMYLGVDGYKNVPHDLGKYLGLFFAVLVFILAGFEHCIANMYYISIAGRWCGETVLLLLVSTAGNIVGGVLFPVLQKAAEFCHKEEKK
jgi:formate/nitrite transporter FocA (FNT family)